MHEMSIALAVVGQVEEAARDRGVTAVRAVRLQVGELAGVVPDALAFCFELACAGTVLEGAELVAEPVPGRARCAPCADEWAVGMPPNLCCPGCGEPTAELLAGRELQIVSVRWEDGQDHACADGQHARPGEQSERTCEPVLEER
ncbi:hydrogenase maturation nickel metallochaperone HypA [Streptomyces sp. NPDC000410]|uniref:hydrogenase maturation nickel metallochaperone HypA/HybF n=1 Tax=Streptomyces sp. NPDC000410 TaxID=3154254 RepID=UPI003318DAD8